MRLSFYGASHEVTGSNTLLEANGKKILIDCGMFQGGDENQKKNHDPFLYNPADIDVLLLTHAHLDHCGRIPKLVKDGFTGTIYATKATCELARLIWDDTESIMQHEFEKYGNEKLFEIEHIEAATALCKGVDYNQPIDIGGGEAVWKDAGHIFGASFIELSIEGKKFAFSGDIGNENVPILRDTQDLSEGIDVLLCESTYGDRLHEDTETGREIILRLVSEAAKKGGTIMMPAFSLERTQEILYRLHNIKEHDHALQNLPIFLDSPLATRAIPVYKKYPSYYDEEAMAMYKQGDDFLDFPRLKVTESVNDSKAINAAPTPKMIIAGSGMMTGGRILHHLLRYLSDPNSTLIIVGYQAEGTLGRKLYEGATKVTIFHEEIEVKCTIKAIGVLSAHGDQKKLLRWAGTGKPKKVFCTHGEPHAATELAHRIRDTYPGTETHVPEFGETVEI